MLGSASTKQAEPITDASPSVVQSPSLDDNIAVDDLRRETVDHPIKEPSEPAASEHDAFVNQMNQFQEQNLANSSEYRDEANSWHGLPPAE